MVHKKKKKTILLTLGFAITLCILIINRSMLLSSNSLEHYFSYGMYPLMVVQQKCIEPIKNGIHHRKTNSQLQTRITQLQGDYEKLVAQNIELQSTLDYLQDIQELRAFKSRYCAQTMLLTQILSRQLSENGHICWIDAGSTKGVTKDMIAVHKNCLVGRVTEVYPWYSKLELVTDKSCKIAAHCVNSKASGIYQGLNSEFHAQLNHVSHLATLQDNDVIISSGEGLVFPRGFGIGKIRSHHVDGLFYAIDIQPLLDVRAVSHCYLIQRDTNDNFEFTE
ncbi:hypothetical protein Noda2021_03470 [Candidatus Dependentiae bacterium Noda2021]|nr:hypothetical protein Noda2021_03470 [Candidatus Dependentiae bacterium Noda2021]